MMNIRQLAATIAIGSLAAVSMSANSSAARKSWAEQCKEEHEKVEDQQRCCTLKTIDCYNVCRGQFEEYSTEEKQCFAACKRTGDRCDAGLKGSRIPNLSTSTPPGNTKTMNKRVCCRMRTHVGWASSTECRTRRGRIVSAKQCNRPNRTIQSGSARICCKTRRGHDLMSSARCRSQRGKQVHLKWCRTMNRREYRRQQRLL